MGLVVGVGEGTRMVKANSIPGLRVLVGGVRHVGLWLLGRFVDRMRIGEMLGEAFGSSGVVHDRGRLLVHLMLVRAGGRRESSTILQQPLNLKSLL